MTCLVCNSLKSIKKHDYWGVEHKLVGIVWFSGCISEICCRWWRDCWWVMEHRAAFSIASKHCRWRASLLTSVLSSRFRKIIIWIVKIELFEIMPNRCSAHFRKYKGYSTDDVNDANGHTWILAKGHSSLAWTLSKVSSIRQRSQGEKHTSGSLSLGEPPLFFSVGGDTKLSCLNSLMLWSFSSSCAAWWSSTALLAFRDACKNSSESWTLWDGWVGRHLWGELLWILLLIFERLATCLVVIELAALGSSPEIVRRHKRKER